MIVFKSQYIETTVRERLQIPEPAKLTQDELIRIECISISKSYIGDIRSTAIIRIWYTEMSTYFSSYSWSSLNLNYNELIKTDGWEEDLRLFSHIHTFFCDEQVPRSIFNYFTELENLGLSNINISDWSFLSMFQNLYTISLNNCGCEGNQAVKFICELYAKQKEKGKGKTRPEDIPHICFATITGMAINDITPFENTGEPFIHGQDLYELNLSNNMIDDVSPLTGICVNTLILNNNNIENIDDLNLSNTDSIYLKCNRIKSLPSIEKFCCRIIL